MVTFTFVTIERGWLFARGEYVFFDAERQCRPNFRAKAQERMQAGKGYVARQYNKRCISSPMFNWQRSRLSASTPANIDPPQIAIMI